MPPPYDQNADRNSPQGHGSFLRRLSAEYPGRGISLEVVYHRWKYSWFPACSSGENQPSSGEQFCKAKREAAGLIGKEISNRCLAAVECGIVCNPGKAHAARYWIESLHPREMGRTVNLKRSPGQRIAMRAVGRERSFQFKKGKLARCHFQNCRRIQRINDYRNQICAVSNLIVLREDVIVCVDCTAFQQRIEFSPAPKMVYTASGAVAARIPWTENDDIVRRCRQDVRFRPSGRQGLARNESLVRRPGFPTVGGVPVAGDDHAAVRQRKGRRQGALGRHYANRCERVRLRIVKLRAETLADSEMLLAATAQKNATVRKAGCEAVDVRIEHRHRVPSAFRIVFRRFQRLESVGLATQQYDFIANGDSTMATSRRWKVRQPLHRQGVPLGTVRRSDSVPSGMGRRTCCDNCQICSYEYGDHSHLHKDTELSANSRRPDAWHSANKSNNTCFRSRSIANRGCCRYLRLLSKPGQLRPTSHGIQLYRCSKS